MAPMEAPGMIEAVVSMKDGTQTRVYAAGFIELFSQLDYENMEAVEACTIDLGDMRQGRDGRRSG